MRGPKGPVWTNGGKCTLDCDVCLVHTNIYIYMSKELYYIEDYSKKSWFEYSSFRHKFRFTALRVFILNFASLCT